MKTQREIYAELQKAWVEANNIKEGDSVRVIGKAVHGQCGWYLDWASAMDIAVGKVLTVVDIDEDAISFDGLYWYPFFCLEKVENEAEPDEQIFNFDDNKEFDLHVDGHNYRYNQVRRALSVIEKLEDYFETGI